MRPSLKVSRGAFWFPLHDPDWNSLAGFLGSAFAADNFSGYLVNWVYKDLGFHALPVSVLDTLSVIVITIILSYLR